jgi:hypothetical protein
MKLEVKHAGASGILCKSAAGSGSYSLIDIDADNGDAALRFRKAGALQWNLRNNPANNNFDIFEMGAGERLSIQKGTGFIGINSTNPSYQLDVQHGGASGILCRSSATYSVIDIDAASGDAALRFMKAGTNQWNVRNEPGTDNFQIFELGGGGERLQIQNATGNIGIGITPTAKLHVNGSFTATGTKAFTIDHPLDPENKILRHFALESPEVLNVYSGTVVTDKYGKANIQLPDYFEAINKDFRYQLTVVGTFAQAIISKEIIGNKFEIATNQPNVKVCWQVTGIRNDGYMKFVNTLQTEEMKSADYKGKYIEPKAFNLPENRGVNYSNEENQKGSSLQNKIIIPDNKPTVISGSIAN